MKTQTSLALALAVLLSGITAASAADHAERGQGQRHAQPEQHAADDRVGGT